MTDTEPTTFVPDPDALYVIGFSGGKDSVATWLHLTRELKLPNVICVFADTGHEAPELHLYLDYLEEECGCDLYRITGSMQQLNKSLKHEPITMTKLAAHKKRFPSPTARFCTTELKLKPVRSFLDDVYGRPYRYRPYFIADGKLVRPSSLRIINVSGVRADESAKRAKMDAFIFDEFMQTDRWLPLLQWTALDTFGCHDRHEVRPNPLYQKGCSRVGCYPCIMSNKSELANLSRYTDAMERLGAMEREATILSGRPPDHPPMSFFGCKTAPRRYSSQTCPNTGKPYPLADDVKRWALSDDPNPDQQTLGLDDDISAPTCLSVYGLCS